MAGSIIENAGLPYALGAKTLKVWLHKIPEAVRHVPHLYKADQHYGSFIRREFPMLRFLLLHLSALVLAQFLFLAAAAQAVWQPFSDQEAGFTISFPGKPNYEAGGVLQNGDPEETYKFNYGEHFLWVKFAPLTRVPRNSVELSRIYAEITRDFSKAGTLVRQEKLLDGGRQYYNVVDVSSGRLHMLTRVYLHGGRQYHLIYGTFAPTGINEGLADRFFSSFRFIDFQPDRAGLVHRRLPNVNKSGVTERSRWYVLRGSDGDFVVEFPGRPEYSLMTQPEIGTDVHRFRFFFGDNLFVLSYWKMPKGSSESGQALLRVVNNHVAGERARGQILKRVSLPGGGYEVESQGIFNNLLLHSRVRFYVRGARIYTLTTMTPDTAEPILADLDRFFRSFHFNKP